MATFKLTIADVTPNNRVLFKPAGYQYTDDEIINIFQSSRAIILRNPDYYNVSQWRKDLYKVIRSLGVCLISFNDSDKDDLRCYFDLHGIINVSSIYITICEFIFFNKSISIHDQNLLLAKLEKKLNVLKFVKGVCWTPSKISNPPVPCQDNLIVEIDLLALNKTAE